MTERKSEENPTNIKYRKRPVVIEAYHWKFDNTLNAPPAWLDDALNTWPETNSINFEPEHPDGPRICIATLEGVMIARPGDYIIKGVEGELYPCKESIFNSTYEKV